jgi:hypothetical protein
MRKREERYELTFVSRLSFFVVDALPTATFTPHVTTSAAIPATFFPAMSAVRLKIATWNPHIASAIPAVIAAMPFPARMRRRSRAFIDRCGRTNTNNDLCSGEAGSQCEYNTAGCGK